MAANQAAKKQAQQAYQKLAGSHRPRPPFLKNCLLAFLVGGAICTLGQGVLNYFRARGLPNDRASAATAITMIFLGSFLTAVGLYDEIGKVGGAGSALPITGFANSIVAAAVEFRTEGMVMGMAARMFQIAGPVIVFGVTSSLVVAVLRYLLVKG